MKTMKILKFYIHFRSASPGPLVDGILGHRFPLTIIDIVRHHLSTKIRWVSGRPWRTQGRSGLVDVDGNVSRNTHQEWNSKSTRINKYGQVMYKSWSMAKSFKSASSRAWIKFVGLKVGGLYHVRPVIPRGVKTNNHSFTVQPSQARLAGGPCQGVKSVGFYRILRARWPKPVLQGCEQLQSCSQKQLTLWIQILKAL